MRIGALQPSIVTAWTPLRAKTKIFYYGRLYTPHSAGWIVFNMSGYIAIEEDFMAWFIFAKEVNADVCHFMEDSKSPWGFTRVKTIQPISVR